MPGLAASGGIRPASAPIDLDEIRAAVALVRELLQPDEVLVICGDGMEVASQAQHANGTYQVTCKRKDNSG